MNTRQFRHSVSIYEAPGADSLDARGQPNASPTLIASGVPCKVRQTAAGEREISNQQTGVGSHTVTMHVDSQINVTTSSHLIWDGRTLNVIGSFADEKNSFLTVLCQEAKE